MDSNKQQTQLVDVRLDWAILSFLPPGAVIVLATFSCWVLAIDPHVVRAWMLSGALPITSFALMRPGPKTRRGRREPGTQVPRKCMRT